MRSVRARSIIGCLGISCLPMPESNPLLLAARQPKVTISPTVADRGEVVNIGLRLIN
jgi:hypothetical protein